jgi:hypothetical protein
MIYVLLSYHQIIKAPPPVSESCTLPGSTSTRSQEGKRKRIKTSLASRCHHEFRMRCSKLTTTSAAPASQLLQPTTSTFRKKGVPQLVLDPTGHAVLSNLNVTLCAAMSDLDTTSTFAELLRFSTQTITAQQRHAEPGSPNFKFILILNH